MQCRKASISRSTPFVLSVVGVGADPQAAGPATQQYLSLHALPPQRVRIAAGQLEAHDAALVAGRPVAEDRGPNLRQPSAGEVGDLQHSREMASMPKPVSNSTLASERRQPGDVLRAAFVAGGRVFEDQFDVAEIVLDCATLFQPTPTGRSRSRCSRRMKKMPAPSGPEQPLVAVGREEIDRRAAHVQRERRPVLGWRRETAARRGCGPTRPAGRDRAANRWRRRPN